MYVSVNTVGEVEGSTCRSGLDGGIFRARVRETFEIWMRVGLGLESRLD